MAATLDAFLSSYASRQGGIRSAVAAVVHQLAGGAIKIRHRVSQGRLLTGFSEKHRANSDGDIQRGLDLFADQIFFEACRQAPVAAYASEERSEPIFLDKQAPVAVAVDPLDGSSNIDTNVSIGTIFSLLAATPARSAENAADSNPAAAFLQAGHNQIGAGFFIYGPQLALVLSLGSGTHIFAYSARLGTFVQTHESVVIPPRTQEFAINASNYRHWDPGIQLYIDDCLKGCDGPREKDFNMRWIASLVADTYRILMRGGIFIYPADQRRGYSQGRLRLIYEANPIAYLVGQAGGVATDTIHPILDVIPDSLHQRVPLAFGSSKEVVRLARYRTEPSMIAERAPLFGRRGLFRA